MEGDSQCLSNCMEGDSRCLFNCREGDSQCLSNCREGDSQGLSHYREGDRKAKEKYRKKIESKFRAVAVFVLLGKVSGTWQLLTRRLHLVGQGSVWRRWLMRHAKPHEQFLHSFRNT